MKRNPIPICLLCALVLLQIGTARLNAQMIQNPSFETPVVGPVGNYNSYQFNPTGAVWTFTGNAGIAAKASKFAPAPFSTNGNQIAFLEGVSGVGGTMSQTISNFPAGYFNYTFTFMASQWGNQTETVTVLVDGTNVGSFTPPSSWGFFQTIPITLYAGNHVLSFTNLPVALLSAVGVDNVGLTATSAALPVKIAAGNYYSLILKSDGSLWGSGANWSGQLGDGTYNMTTNRFEQTVSNGVIAIAAGGDMDAAYYSQSLFIKSNGSLWGMGLNQDGELGDGTTVNKNLPEQIVSSNVVAIAAGYYYSLFLKSDGSLWAMGRNGYGQLGDGTYTDRHQPEEIVASGVTAISAGTCHSLFLKSDGSLWGMGYNYYGELGDGSYNSINIPEEIVASNVTAIATGLYHSLFLKSDGSVWGMGSDFWGQLGDGSYNYSTNIPEEIVASNVTAIAAGYYNSLFLKSDGSLWAVGDNSRGELGDGTSFSKTNQVEQIVASGVTAISAGKFHSLFLKNDGSQWGMGDQGYGELGDANYGAPKYMTNLAEQIVTGPIGYNQVAIQTTSDGDVILSFLGIVGANYALDYASSLTPPNWLPLVTNSAGNGGMLSFTNTPDATTNNFWRIRSVP